MNDTPLDPKLTDPDQASKIYFLPNLMTSLNLFCGFGSVIRCIQAWSAANTGDATTAQLFYTQAVYLILAAVFFDGLDGRLARLGGRESIFGKEFDSIADVVSFGMAPSLMVFFHILAPTEGYPFFRDIGWIIGFIYLLCVGIRLARFNVITHPLMEKNEISSCTDFIGLPCPAAAGMISSLVLVLNQFDLNSMAILLPVLMILIAYLMVSSIRYPSFKHVDWNTRMRFTSFIAVIIVIALIMMYRSVGVSALFLTYIFYGIFVHLKKRFRKPTSAE